MKPAHMMNKVRKSCASYQSDKNNADIQQPWPSTVISAKPTALDRPHVCPHCSAAFIQSCSLRIHMASTHGGNLKAVHRDSSIPDGGVGSCGERTGKEDKGKARHTVGDGCYVRLVWAGTRRSAKWQSWCILCIDNWCPICQRWLFCLFIITHFVMHECIVYVWWFCDTNQSG